VYLDFPVVLHAQRVISQTLLAYHHVPPVLPALMPIFQPVFLVQVASTVTQIMLQTASNAKLATLLEDQVRLRAVLVALVHTVLILEEATLFPVTLGLTLAKWDLLLARFARLELL
jgi:hypothetical protein